MAGGTRSDGEVGILTNAASAPGMGDNLLYEKRQPERVTRTVGKRKPPRATEAVKEAWNKGTTVRTGTG